MFTWNLEKYIGKCQVNRGAGHLGKWSSKDKKSKHGMFVKC